MSRLRNEDGFTLVELLVGAMLMIIVMFASLGVLDQVTRLSARTDQRVDLQDRARQVTRTLARSLRNVAPSPEFPVVIGRAGAYDIVFRSVDRPPTGASANARNLKRVRYCLDESNPDRARLLEQSQRWTTQTAPAMPADTACPAASWGPSRLVADYVTNRSGGSDRPLWTYGQTGGQVTSVRVNLFMNKDPDTPGVEVSSQTGVYLRNQNRAPTGLFTAAPAGVRHVLLNGSTSSDPEGEPLNYFWFVNGAEVGRGLIFDYAAPAGGTYEFRLDVRDPSGLLGRSDTRTVVIP
jgi:type II secretory pathway pseudopilin PulG